MKAVVRIIREKADYSHPGILRWEPLRDHPMRRMADIVITDNVDNMVRPIRGRIGFILRYEER